MKTSSEKILAERILQAHEQGGQLPFSYVRSNAKFYWITAGIFGALMLITALEQRMPAFFLIMGTAIGVFCRDIAWIQTTQRAWPFYERIIDWDKVRKLAQTEHDP
jgi:hypothetical protein